MDTDWVDTSQPSGRQAVPVVLAVLVGLCGICLPFTEASYVPAFAAAMVFAVATPLTLWLVAPKDLFKRSRTFRRLFIAGVFFALCAVVTGGMLMALGSPAGAGGDIGGLPLWLLSTVGLVAVPGCAITSWRREHAGPPTTLRGLQRLERHHQKHGQPIE